MWLSALVDVIEALKAVPFARSLFSSLRRFIMGTTSCRRCVGRANKTPERTRRSSRRGGHPPRGARPPAPPAPARRPPLLTGHLPPRPPPYYSHPQRALPN